MKLQQILILDYLKIPFEDFSHKAVAALGLLTSLRYSAFIGDAGEGKTKQLDDAIAKVKEIIEICSKDVQISLFVLDRNIIPQDMAKTTTNFIVNFKRQRKVKDQENARMSQDQIQDILCNALKDIHVVVMQEIATMSDQVMLDSDTL